MSTDTSMKKREEKKIHFIGIGGIGISALSKIFLSQGVVVTGSDATGGEGIDEMRKRGAHITIGHLSKNIRDDIDRVVYSEAIPKENPERQEAEKQSIPCSSYAQMLGKMMREHFAIAVSGTNGKTTTTAMLGKIFENAGTDPSVIVGGRVPGWDGNLRLPLRIENAQKKESVFIAEGCEYRRNMMNLHPQQILLTNIEADHLDYYKDLDDILHAFGEYISKLPIDGKLIYNIDDTHCERLTKNAPCKAISYGIKRDAEVRAKNIRVNSNAKKMGQYFELWYHGKSLGEFFLPLPSSYNISNALGAIAVALEYGIKKEDIRSALLDFRGTWRRFERKGTYGDVEIISDYAHHPSAVKKTIEGAKEFYGNKKILAVFQPHQKDRTKKLFNDFVKSFDHADGIILSEIYEVAGREEEDPISAFNLAESIGKRQKKEVFYEKNLQKTKEKVLCLIGEYDVLLIMGAGDIYQIADELVKDAPEKRENEKKAEKALTLK